jgi:hypothetical protein
LTASPNGVIIPDIGWDKVWETLKGWKDVPKLWMFAVREMRQAH